MTIDYTRITCSDKKRMNNDKIKLNYIHILDSFNIFQFKQQNFDKII